MKLTRLNTTPLTTRISDTSYQPGLYSVNLKDRPTFQFSNVLPINSTWEGTLITTWDADPADGDQTGDEIFFMEWMNEEDAQGNTVEVRPTVTIQNVATLTNETGVVVEPASANIYKNPETNEYVDAEITNKEVTITVPGDFFNRTDNRYIEIKQGDTIRKEKTLITGDAVLEDYLNQQTTITFTEDFSDYTKDVDAVVSIYLTNTATKAVAEATINVVEMPFKLVFFKTDHLGTPRMVTDHDGTILTTHDFLAYGEELTDPDFQTNRMKFTGHERDPETGLDYMMARYYSAGVGRFLQVDPGGDYSDYDPMSWNLYGYCRGNPVTIVDPSGKSVYKDSTVNEKEKQRVLKELAEKTGYKVGDGKNGTPAGLYFNKNGKLCLAGGATHTKGKGSAKARSTLAKAMSDAQPKSMIVAVNHGGTAYTAADVAFMVKSSDGNVYVDFDDFAETEALDENEGFDFRQHDIASQLMHEWSHLFFGTDDPPDGDTKTRGEAVVFANEVRAELGLKERTQYHASPGKPGLVKMLFEGKDMYFSLKGVYSSRNK